MQLEIRPYQPDDRDEWMRVHAIIMTLSHAWNYCIQERPLYEGHQSTKLVGLHQDKIIALTDVQYENYPGELCFQKQVRSGYVLEFGRLPEYAGHHIGQQLIDATIIDAKKKGFNRLEYWSQDRAAQRFYRRIGLKEIGRHYRFRIKPPQKITEILSQDYIGLEYLYGACVPEEWPAIKQKYEIIERHPLEPHICVGFELLF